MTRVATTAEVTMEQAGTAVKTSVRKARDLNLLMNVAVVDAGASLKSFVRMDGAWLGSTDIAIKKARTARLLDMESGYLSPMVQPGPAAVSYRVLQQWPGHVPGGTPLKASDGRVVGAIGMSDSTVGNDRAVAQADVSAFDSAMAQREQ